MLRRLVYLLLVAVLVGGASQGAWAKENNRDRILTVMTRNMDTGSDFLYVLQAAGTGDPVLIVGAITMTFQEMLDSKIAERADGIAAEIGATLPDLVGLQEVTIVSVGPPDGHATTTVADALQSLMAALNQRGLHYAVLKQQTNSDVEVPAFDPSSGPFTVRLTDLDVVLVRKDLPVSELKVEAVDAAHFETYLKFPVLGTEIPFLRGWISVDAKLRGKVYRFVTTHLETFSPEIQYYQTQELLLGPLNTGLPVVLAGDMNSNAYGGDNMPAYALLVGAGFLDAWSALFPYDAGYTWPLHAEDPYGPVPPEQVRQRIDLVLLRGSGILPNSIALAGTAPIGDLWSSDHAGVFAGMKLLP